MVVDISFNVFEIYLAIDNTYLRGKEHFTLLINSNNHESFHNHSLL